MLKLTRRHEEPRWRLSRRSSLSKVKGLRVLGIFLVCLGSLVSLQNRSLFFSFLTNNKQEDGLVEDPPLRVFRGVRRLQDEAKYEKRSAPPTVSRECDRWAVLLGTTTTSTADAPPAGLKGWCLVILADETTPMDYITPLQGQSNIIFLSLDDQTKIAGLLLRRQNDLSRKNVGFLFAIAHGAKVVYEFDRDVVLKDHAFGLHQDYVPPFTLTVRYLNDGSSFGNTSSAFNPLPFMGPSVKNIWPRGFPLSEIKESSGFNPVFLSGMLQFGQLSHESIGVIQILADGDPDVDAIYHLTRSLPVVFDSSSNASHLLAPSTAYTPYNAQATAHLYKAFWGLAMPSTVSRRTSDIWRAYASQRIMKDVGIGVMYAPPRVYRETRWRNYIDDLTEESELYLKTGDLLAFLDGWSDSASTLPARIENLWIALYEHRFVELEDVSIIQEWLLALAAVGYQFPSVIGEQETSSHSCIGNGADLLTGPGGTSWTNEGWLKS